MSLLLIERVGERLGLVGVHQSFGRGTCLLLRERLPGKSRIRVSPLSRVLFLPVGVSDRTQKVRSFPHRDLALVPQTTLRLFFPVPLVAEIGPALWKMVVDGSLSFRDSWSLQYEGTCLEYALNPLSPEAGDRLV